MAIYTAERFLVVCSIADIYLSLAIFLVQLYNLTLLLECKNLKKLEENNGKVREFSKYEILHW